MQNGDSSSSLPPPEFTYPTLLIHSDDHLAPTTDIAPALHPSTTYHYPIDESTWKPAADGFDEFPSEPVYSRLSYSTLERAEKVLGELMGGYCLTYGSGLNAIHALFVHVNPKRVCISSEAGYHGTKGVASIINRLNGLVFPPAPCRFSASEMDDFVEQG